MGRHTYLLAAILLAAIAVLMAAPAPSFADDRLVVIYPRIYNFPGQQLCQVDRNDRRYREFCSPQSYHPYGASGYRPYGTYPAVSQRAEILGRAECADRQDRSAKLIVVRATDESANIKRESDFSRAASVAT